MKITLTANVGPIEQTGNENYRAGAQVDFPDRHARWLIMRDLATEGWGQPAPPVDVVIMAAQDDPSPDYAAMKVGDLRKLAEERGMSTEGLRKAHLVRILEEDDVRID